MFTELLTRSLSAQRRSALIWSAALLILVTSVLAVWPAMSESGSLDSLVTEMSPEVISALGLEALSSPAGFLNGNLYALFLPLLISMLGILHMNTLTAGDEDAGRLELLLALPVSRFSVYLSRFLAVALVLAGVSVLVGATIGVGGAALEMDLEVSGVLAVSVSLFLLALFHAAVALALAGLGLRSGVVLGGACAVLILGYLVHALLPLIDSLSGVSAISPWHWALGEQPLESGFDVGAITLLMAGTVVCAVVGLIAVRRRTIRTT